MRIGGRRRVGLLAAECLAAAGIAVGVVAAHGSHATAQRAICTRAQLVVSATTPHPQAPPTGYVYRVINRSAVPCRTAITVLDRQPHEPGAIRVEGGTREPLSFQVVSAGSPLVVSVMVHECAHPGLKDTLTGLWIKVAGGADVARFPEPLPGRCGYQLVG